MFPSMLGHTRQKPSDPANLPAKRRRKTAQEKPALRVDCIQPPAQQLAPQPFSAQLNRPQGYTFSPSYPFNLGQRHEPPQSWTPYPAVEFQRDYASFGPGVDLGFLDTCKTSVTSSCAWTTSRQASSQCSSQYSPHYSSVLVSSTLALWPPFSSQLGRDDMIASIAARLDRLKHAVVTETEAMEEMLSKLTQDLSSNGDMSGDSRGC